jgi:hypothetical protein
MRWRQLDEIHAGVCDGMTYEEIAEKMPGTYFKFTRMSPSFWYVCTCVIINTFQSFELPRSALYLMQLNTPLVKLISSVIVILLANPTRTLSTGEVLLMRFAMKSPAHDIHSLCC